jgi:hypothetical protein
MLAHEVVAASTEEAAEDEGDNKNVVELTHDRNEVRNEVEWKREITDEGPEEQLSAAGHAVVSQQAGDEDEAVRDKPRECAGVLATVDGEESQNEPQPGERDQTERKREPQPPRHGAILD